MFMAQLSVLQLELESMLAWLHRHRGKLALLGAAVAGMGGQMDAKKALVNLCACRQLPGRSVAAAEGWRAAAEAAELRAGEHEVRALGNRRVRGSHYTAAVEIWALLQAAKTLSKQLSDVPDRWSVSHHALRTAYLSGLLISSQYWTSCQG